MKKADRITALEKRSREQGRLIEQLARALLTHTRTDLAPDAGLPLMQQIVDEAKKHTKENP